MPQFTVPFSGIDLHYLHVPGIGPNPMPLLLSHGWPGSVCEFHKLIPLLTDPARFGGDPADAFTVVAPSLPGYGFSFPPGQPRFGMPDIADAVRRADDRRAGLSSASPRRAATGARSSPPARASHAEHAPRHPPEPAAAPPRSAAADGADRGRAGYRAELERLAARGDRLPEIQGTKPQTLAYGLTDSPVGLAAWIVEKFRTWSDCGGDVERALQQGRAADQHHALLGHRRDRLARSGRTTPACTRVGRCPAAPG